MPDETFETDQDDEDPDHNNDACRLYKSQVFYRLLDSLLKEIKNLWKYQSMKEEDVQAQSLTFAVDYTVDFSEHRLLNIQMGN